MTDLPLSLTVDEMLADPELREAKIEVLLNGTVRGEVVSYNIPGRTIVRYATDEQGNFVVEGDEVKRETLTGDVAVRIKPTE